MTRERGKSTIGQTKGGHLLGELMKQLAPSPSAPALAKPSSGRTPPSIEEELKAAFAHRGGPPPPRIAHKPQKKGKPKQEIIRIADPVARRAAIAAARAAGPLASDRLPAQPSLINDLGAGAFQKLSVLRSKLDGFTATHGSGQVINAADIELIIRRIAKGASAVDMIVDADDGYFIGYDFGTSTTKAVARDPYAGVDVAFAIDVPKSLASGGQAHLWPTAIWWNKSSGQISAFPQEGFASLDSFKSALIEGRSHRICGGSGMTMAEAATAFVAMHLAYVLGAAIERKPDLRLAGINIGVPVAALSETATVSMFERIIRAGIILVAFGPDLTLADVRAALANDEPAPLLFTLHTELSGAIAGYCATPRHYVGGHMIIDCGSATLDMASFALDGTSYKPIGIYEARVERLGADACLIYQEHGATVMQCRDASRHQEHLVFAKTLQRELGRFIQEERRFPYQLILIGGGIHSDVHAALFETMETAFHRGFHRPQVAATLSYDEGCEPGRLILADGLARDPIELREVAMPRDPPPARYRSPEMITKDQM